MVLRGLNATPTAAGPTPAATRLNRRLVGGAAAVVLLAVLAGLTYSFALSLTAMTPGAIQATIMAIVSFALVATIFAALERVSPEQSVRREWRQRERRADVCWWFVGYGSRFAADITTFVCVALIIRVLPDHPTAMVNTQPLWLQMIEALLIGDFLQYWVHRCLHGRRLWSVHAIHHSPEDLNWLSATRIHPLEVILKGPIEMAPLYFLGFSSVATLPLVVIVLGLYELFLHANVGWRFGALRFVIASPAFHRWHHTAEVEGFDKDFAGLFPFYDLAFGTYFLPDRASSAYGLGRGQRMSSSFWRQLINPGHSAVDTIPTARRRLSSVDNTQR